MTLLTSNKADFETKELGKPKEEYFRVIKVSIHWPDIKVCVHLIRGFKTHVAKINRIKEKRTTPQS